MQEKLNLLGGVVLVGVIFDLLILMGLILNIASGGDAPHIAFWDAQLKAVVYLLK